MKLDTSVDNIAESARKIATSILEERKKDIRNDKSLFYCIYKQINYACLEGKMSVFISFKKLSLSNEILDVVDEIFLCLRGRGFDSKLSDDKLGIIVSWEEKKSKDLTFKPIFV